MTAVGFAVIGYLVVGYLIVGVPAAAYLHLGGLVKRDPAVKGAGLGFRVLITPGLLVFWPLLLFRRPPDRPDRPFSPAQIQKAQRRAMYAVLVVGLIAIAFGVWSWRRQRTVPAFSPAVRGVEAS